jgi:hypothetical protein
MTRAALIVSFILALICAPAAYADSGLVAWWTFDEGSGTVAQDASGNGNDGVVSGPAEWTQGYFGSALSFDGGTARVHVDDGSPLEPKSSVSVAAWVNSSTAQGTDKYIIAKGASSCSAASYGLYTGLNGGLRFYVSQNNGGSFTLSPDAGSRVWNGGWHFVVGTYDGSSVRLYVDGRQVGDGTPMSGAIDYKYADNDLFIGHYNGCSALDFKGAIDEPQVWSRALSSSDVGSAYSSLVALHDGTSVAAPNPLPLPQTLPGPSTSAPPSSPSHGGTGSTAPAISKFSLAGLGSGTPRLGLTLTRRKTDAPIKSFTITLPSGLQFARTLKQVQRGVKLVQAGRYTLSLHRGQLDVVLAKPARTFAITLGSQALAESSSLAKRVADVVNFNRVRKHLKKRVVTLKVAMRLTDSARRSTNVSALVSIS